MSKTIIIRFYLVCLIVICSHSSHGQEDKFKALFIYKFAEYVEWPSGKNNVVIGIAGKKSVYQELFDLVASKTNMTVTVLQLNGPSDVNKCDILFLSSSLDKQINLYSAAIGAKSILVVSESSSLVGKGSDIGFYLESGKLRFLISEAEIRRKKMTPSSKLLTLGKSI